MELIFEHYGRLLSTNLPAYLRKTVQVEVENSLIPHIFYGMAGYNLNNLILNNSLVLGNGLRTFFITFVFCIKRQRNRSLLNALNSGEFDAEEMKENAAEKQVKNYDFARPAKNARIHNSFDNQYLYL